MSGVKHDTGSPRILFTWGFRMTQDSDYFKCENLLKNVIMRFPVIVNITRILTWTHWCVNYNIEQTETLEDLYTPKHSPDRWCPCWRSGQSSCTWGYYICSCLGWPGVCGQSSQFFPLWEGNKMICKQTKVSQKVSKYKHRATSRLTSPPPELHLVPLEIGLVLHYFYKSLWRKCCTMSLTCAYRASLHNIIHPDSQHGSGLELAALACSFQRVLNMLFITQVSTWYAFLTQYMYITTAAHEDPCSNMHSTVFLSSGKAGNMPH